MLQQEEPDDYVISTGETRSVREFADIAFQTAGIKLRWEGEGVDEKAYDENGVERVCVNPAFFRPAEVELLLGDATKAEQKLGWKREISFEELVQRMVKNDLEIVKG